MTTARYLLVAVTFAGIAYYYQQCTIHGIYIKSSRQVDGCTPDIAFATVTEFEIMKELSSDILGYEFHNHKSDDDNNGNGKTPQPKVAYLGLKFSETRSMGKDQEPLVTTLDVTEFDLTTYHARMVADTHGTIWDTTFDVEETSNGVIFNMVMHAKAHELLPKILNPIMQILFRYGISNHMDAIQTWCKEKQK